MYRVVFIDAINVKDQGSVARCVKAFSARVGRAFAEQVEAGAAEHLTFDHLEAVDVAFDRAGAVRQGQAVAAFVHVDGAVSGAGRREELLGRDLRVAQLEG